MAKVHVWMLYRGGPTKSSNMKSFFHCQMKDPFLLNLGRGFFQGLWMKWLFWWRRHDIQSFQLTGPCPSHLFSNEQSRELNRILGSDYACTNVHRYDGKSAAERIKETPTQTTVLLLPLVPFRGGILYSTLDEARTQLQAKGIPYIEAPPLSKTPSFPIVYAECIRETIISLQGNNKYAILIFVSKDALNWNKLEPELQEEIDGFRRTIQQILNPAIQIFTALSTNEAIEKLNTLDDTEHILYGHPISICDSYEELPILLSELPFTFHQIPNLNNRPSFMRTLAEMVWKFAPVE
jgi:protoheme ferro-lyase